MKPELDALIQAQQEFSELFTLLAETQLQIRNKLRAHADGKVLKGDELVGWLGEIYTKIFLAGKLVDDSHEHDVETPDGWKVSVKTRRGKNSGWARSSAIPKMEGDDCPSHLMFVSLGSDYTVKTMWLYPWQELLKSGRFKTHTVRQQFRSFYMCVSPKGDERFKVFEACTKPTHFAEPSENFHGSNLENRRPQESDCAILHKPVFREVARMIVHEQVYREFIASRGVGRRDVVASSVGSYVSYLRSVSEILGEAITPKMLRDDADMDRICARIEGMRAPKTIRNYRSAMRQYVALVQSMGETL